MASSVVVSVFKPSPVALAALLFSATLSSAQAQSKLPSVAVSGRAAESPLALGGFGEVPLHKLPLQAQVLSAERQKDAGVQRLADITNFDASVSDAYNSGGYVDYLTVRGYVLDNRFNFQRDGLPINAESSLPLANKAAMEVLKGISGMQAGTSAPGGAVNLLVKRPTTQLSAGSLAWRSDNTLEASVDLSQRFGPQEALGLRVNAAYAHLDPTLRDAKGQRHLLALAGDWKLTPNTLVEAEIEQSRQSQRSQPGFSMLGSTLPDAKTVDPRINLNNQAWSLPVVFNATTASLRLQQQLSADWRATAHLGAQRLRTDDRLAYANGKYDPETYACDPCDRYAADGTFTIWDFRSENEHRDTDALKLSMDGKFKVAGMQHQLSSGVLFSRFQSRFQRQAYNLAGVGNVQGTAITPAAPDLTDENTNRDERNTEFFVNDALSLSDAWRLWAGLRHTRLHRESVRTDGSRATSYSQSFTTPWLAVSYAISPQYMVYGSWGQGVESDVAPNRKRYINAGQALTPLKSTQAELGIKSGTVALDWSLNVFDIRRPQSADIGDCEADLSCERKVDGKAHHRGVEAMGDFKWQDGGLLASAMWLQARREGSATASQNGQRPTNVPNANLKLQLRQRIRELPGLTLLAGVVHEGNRMVLPDNSVRIPAWTRLDLGARFDQSTGWARLTWRAGVDNIANTRAWKESPYQYGHVYLYPLAPRTLRASLEIQLP